MRARARACVRACCVAMRCVVLCCVLLGCVVCAHAHVWASVCVCSPLELISAGLTSLKDMLLSQLDLMTIRVREAMSDAAQTRLVDQVMSGIANASQSAGAVTQNSANSNDASKLQAFRTKLCAKLMETLHPAQDLAHMIFEVAGSLQRWRDGCLELTSHLLRYVCR